LVGKELLDVVDAFDEGIGRGVDLVEAEKTKPGGRKWRLNMIFNEERILRVPGGFLNKVFSA